MLFTYFIPCIQAQTTWEYNGKTYINPKEKIFTNSEANKLLTYFNKKYTFNYNALTKTNNAYSPPKETKKDLGVLYLMIDSKRVKLLDSNLNNLDVFIIKEKIIKETYLGKDTIRDIELKCINQNNCNSVIKIDCENEDGIYTIPTTTIKYTRNGIEYFWDLIRPAFGIFYDKKLSL